MIDEMNGAQRLTSKDMPYVTFERGEPRENKQESRKQNRPVYEDTYYAVVTAPGSKDRMKERIPDWWDKLTQQVKTGRLPVEWLEKWKASYARFEQGLTIPEDGTPILGWNLVPPSVQKTLIDLNIRTVEALANLTDEARNHLGMGGREFQRRAQSWIAQNQDKGPLAIEMAAVKQENDILKTTVANLEEKVKLLAEQMEKAESTNKPQRSRP
jgi:hypothetical protein